MTPRPRHARAALAALLGALLVGGLMTPATADEYDDQRAATEQRQREVDAAKDALAEQLEGTDAALAQTYAELTVIEAQIPVAEQELAAAEALVAELQRQAALIAQRLTDAEAEEASISAQIEADTARADVTRTAIGEMARDAYRGDLAASSLSAVLDAESTDDFVEQSAMASTALRTQTQALRDLEQINGVNRNREVRLTAVREQITALKAEADAKVVEAEAARVAAEERKTALVNLQAEQQAKAQLMETQKATQLSKKAELEAQEAALARDLAAIVAAQEAERARLAAEAAAAGKPAPNPTGSTASAPFINPSSVSPMVVTSSYGQRFHPIWKEWRLHAGTDIRTWCGTPLYAGASGTVEWARARSGYGNQVMINHGYWNGKSLMSSYNHMTSFAVRGGDKVSQGQLIGYSGNTGMSAACHLHLEVYVNGATVDPRPMING